MVQTKLRRNRRRSTVLISNRTLHINQLLARHGVLRHRREQRRQDIIFNRWHSILTSVSNGFDFKQQLVRQLGRYMYHDNQILKSVLPVESKAVEMLFKVAGVSVCKCASLSNISFRCPCKPKLVHVVPHSAHLCIVAMWTASVHCIADEMRMSNLDPQTSCIWLGNRLFFIRLPTVDGLHDRFDSLRIFLLGRSKQTRQMIDMAASEAKQWLLFCLKSVVNLANW